MDGQELLRPFFRMFFVFNIFEAFICSCVCLKAPGKAGGRECEVCELAETVSMSVWVLACNLDVICVYFSDGTEVCV